MLPVIYKEEYPRNKVKEPTFSRVLLLSVWTVKVIEIAITPKFILLIK
jgi:hypothetical protein